MTIRRSSSSLTLVIFAQLNQSFWKLFFRSHAPKIKGLAAQSSTNHIATRMRTLKLGKLVVFASTLVLIIFASEPAVFKKNKQATPEFSLKSIRPHRHVFPASFGSFRRGKRGGSLVSRGRQKAGASALRVRELPGAQVEPKGPKHA